MTPRSRTCGSRRGGAQKAHPCSNRREFSRHQSGIQAQTCTVGFLCFGSRLQDKHGGFHPPPTVVWIFRASQKGQMRDAEICCDGRKTQRSFSFQTVGGAVTRKINQTREGTAVRSLNMRFVSQKIRFFYLLKMKSLFFDTELLACLLASQHLLLRSHDYKKSQ